MTVYHYTSIVIVRVYLCNVGYAPQMGFDDIRVECWQRCFVFGWNDRLLMDDANTISRIPVTHKQHCQQTCAAEIWIGATI